MATERNPYEPPQSTPLRTSRWYRDIFRIAAQDRKWQKALFSAAIQQVVFLLLTALILDGGVTFRRFGFLLILFWCSVFPTSLRLLPRRPRWSRILLQNGTWFLLMLLIVATVFLSMLQ